MPLSRSLLFLLFVPAALQGQQYDVPVTQFWNTLMQTNPATTGLNYKHAASATYHQDSYHFDTHYGINANYAIRLDSISSGIGVSYAYNESLYDHSQVILAHYAYQFRLGTSILSLGGSAGIRTLNNSQGWIAPQTPNDPLLPTDSYEPQFQANAGIAYHWKDLNAGISVTKMNSPSFRPKNGNGFQSYDLVPNYWFFADYTFQLPANMQLRPQVQVMTDEIQATTSVSLMGIWNKWVWAGVNYNSDSYFSGMAGVDIREKYRIGVSYGQWKSGFPGWGTGRSVEVVLAYLLK